MPLREKEPEDPSLLARVFTLFERPGYAVRSGLRGDLAGAGRHLLRTPLDAVGLVDPTQLAGPFLGPSASSRAISALGLRDLPTPEMSDVTRKWGLGRPSAGLDRFLFDAAGGFVTNPVNFVGGAPGLGKGALSSAVRGVGPWAGRIAGGKFVGGLGRQATAVGLLESALNPSGAAAARQATYDALLAAGPRGRALTQLMVGQGAPAERAALLARQLGLERLMSQAAGRRVRLSSPEAAEVGSEALAKAGFLERPGWTFAGMRIPGGEAPYGRLVLGRPDSAAAQAGASWARRSLWDATDAAEKALLPILSPVRGVYDKTMLGLVPQFLRRAAGRAGHLESGIKAESERFAVGVSAPAALQAPAETQAAMRAMLLAADDVRRGAAQPAAAKAAALAQIQHPLARRLAERWWESAERMPAELRAYGGTPSVQELYVPLQAKETLRDALGLTGTQAGGALKPRRNQTLVDYLNALAARAQQGLAAARAAGKPHAGLEEWARAGSDPWGLIETDPRILFTNRWNEHARDVGREALQQVVRRERALGRLRPGTDVDEWVAKQIESLPPRAGAQKLVADLNYHLKRGLYAVWPASHLRNAASAALQAWSDESIGGFEAARIFIRALYEGPLVKFTGALPRDQRGVFLRAAQGGPGSEAARAAAEKMRIGRYSGEEILRGLDQVSSQGGPLDISMDETLRAKVGLAPADQSLRSKVGRAVATLPLTPFELALGKRPGAAADLGYRIATGLEDSFRRQHFLALVTKGVEPSEAVQRVARAFVDYRDQGHLDRWLRDLFLFSRYSVGVVPPTVKAALLKPRTVGLPAAAWRAGEGEEVEAEIQPWQRGMLALRVPGTRYVATQFGTPLEAAAQSLERFVDREKFRQGVLGGLTPPVRLPAEIGTGVSFFSGRPWASFRRPPDWVPGSLLDERGEMAGEWLELLRATPLSRFSAQAPELLRGLTGASDPRRGGSPGTLLSNLTGVRLERPDPEAVARRQARATLERAERSGEVGRVPAWYPRRAELSPEVEEALQAARQRR